MVFSGIPFLYYFLPCTLLLYFIAPKKLKNLVLLLASLLFYGWGEPRFLPVMLFAILQGYVFGLLIERSVSRKRQKLFLVLSIVVSLSLLCYCKYVDFFITNFNAITGLSIPLLRITLPIGISFYTFQILSYVVDVYRREANAQRNLISLAAYVSMFPQLIAGPIVRYTDIDRELNDRKHTFEDIAYGIRRFVIGLSKKVLFANNFYELCELFRDSNEKTILYYWLYAIAYTLHIYFDFSGYSDMAIGLGRMFGFHFPENFNYPYISKSITEFWRRWHISLGSWFRDYVYIPLGGNRVSKLCWFRNIFIVWMLTGFWHGAAWNFIFWGLLFAILLVLEKLFLLKFLKKLPALNHLYVLFFVIISFVLFDATSTAGALQTVGAMFGAGSYPLTSPESLYYLRSFSLLLVLGAFAATPLLSHLVSRLRKQRIAERVINVLEPIVLLLLLLAVTGYLADGSFNPFLYFRF